MHHGNPSDNTKNPTIVRRIREAMQKINEPLGATGEFPDDKLSEADEGEIRLAVAADQEAGKVILDFGKAVAWIGLTPQQARELAESLRERSYEAEGKKR